MKWPSSARRIGFCGGPGLSLFCGGVPLGGLMRCFFLLMLYIYIYVCVYFCFVVFLLILFVFLHVFGPVVPVDVWFVVFV